MKMRWMTSLFLLGTSSLLYAGTDYHVVKKGETLSGIAQKYLGQPVYHRDGSLKRILALNPDIKDIHRIFPHQKIKIASTDDRGLASSESVPPLQTLTPEPAAVDTPAVSIADNTENPTSHLGIELGFGYFRVDSTDKQTGAASTLLSGISPETRFTWDLKWNKEWTTRFRFGYRTEKILDDTSVTSHSLQDASGSRMCFEAGAIRNWSERTRTGLAIVFQERIFEHSPNLSTIAIDRVGSPGIKVNQEFDLFHVKSAKMGLGISGEVILPGRGPGYSTETGYGGDAHFYLRHDLKNVSLQGTVYYGLAKQDSSLVEQKETHLGALFGLIWRFEE